MPGCNVSLCSLPIPLYSLGRDGKTWVVRGIFVGGIRPKAFSENLFKIPLPYISGEVLLLLTW